MNQMTRVRTGRTALDLTIRHVRASEGDAVQAILQADHVTRGTMRLPVEAPATAAHRIADAAGAIKLVAEREAQVAGYAELVTYPTLPRHWHCAEVNIVATHPDHQGVGAGRALMERMIDLADNWLQIQRLGHYVWSGNAKAIDLYTSLGFRIEGSMPCFVFLDGAYEDARAGCRSAALSRRDLLNAPLPLPGMTPAGTYPPERIKK